MILARVKISTAESRLEIITPSSKQGVVSKSLRIETAFQPSLSLQIAILDDKFRKSCPLLTDSESANDASDAELDGDRPIGFTKPGLGPVRA